MAPIYRKLNYLASQTAPPEYKNGRMRAGFVRLTIGSWIDRIPGFIQNISLSWQKRLSLGSSYRFNIRW